MGTKGLCTNIILDLEWELRDCVPGISVSPTHPSVIEVLVDEKTK